MIALLGLPAGYRAILGMRDATSTKEIIIQPAVCRVVAVVLHGQTCAARASAS